VNRPLASLLCLLAASTAAGADPALEQTLVARPFAAEGPTGTLALADEGRLVLGTCQGRVALWDAQSGRRLGELPGDGYYAVLAVVGDTLITGEHTRARVQTWSLARRELLAELSLDPDHQPLGVLGTGIPPEPEVVLAPHADASLLAVAWKDEVRLLRLPELELVRLFRSPRDSTEETGGDWEDLHAVEWSSDGRLLRAWNAQRSRGWAWDLSRAPLAVALETPDPHVRPGGEWAAASTALHGGDVVELRAAWNPDRTLHHRLLRLDPHGATRWSTSLPSHLVAWHQVLLALEDQGLVLLSGTVAPTAFSLADGSLSPASGPCGLRDVFAGQRDETLILWDDRNGLWAWDSAAGSEPLRLATPLPDAESRGGRVALLDVDPDLRYAAAALHDGHVLLWELRSGRLLRRWRDGDEPNLTGLAVRAGDGVPRCFYNAFHGEGRLRGGGDEGTIVDYGRGVYLVARDRHDQVSFSRDPQRGTRFALDPSAQALLADDATRLVELETGAEREVSHSLRFVSGQAVGPNGHRLAVAGLHARQQLLQVFENSQAGVTELRREELSGITQDLGFSPDGSMVVAIDRLGALALNLITGARTRIELTGGAAATFLPDGRLALGSRDGSVTVWSLRD
jgi:WD40 repeat protein